VDPAVADPFGPSNQELVAAVVATDDELLGAVIALGEHSYQHGHAVASGNWQRAAAEHRDTVATLACIRHLVDQLRAEGASGERPAEPGRAGEAGEGKGTPGAASAAGKGSADQPATPGA
jgi:hypothetical protein